MQVCPAVLQPMPGPAHKYSLNSLIKKANTSVHRMVVVMLY